MREILKSNINIYLFVICLRISDFFISFCNIQINLIKDFHVRKSNMLDHFIQKGMKNWLLLTKGTNKKILLLGQDGITIGLFPFIKSTNPTLHGNI